MKKIDAEFAIVDIGNSKIAMVIPDADAMTRANELASQAICKAIIVEKLAIAKKIETQETDRDEFAEEQRAEALLKARERAEKKLQQKVKKVLLLAAETDLQATSPDTAPRGQKIQTEVQQAELPKKWRKLNSIAIDRNKRPLALYAMSSEKWKAYERIASYAGVKIVGFLAPAIAVGNALIAQNYERSTGQQRLAQFPKSFIVLDLGARYSSIAMFNDGLPCAIATIDFGSQKFNEALINAFQLTNERAEQLKHSLCFSEDLLNSYSYAINKQKNKEADESAGELTKKYYEQIVEVQRVFPRNIKAIRNPLTQRKNVQGAERILAPIYEKAMLKVTHTLDNIAPRFSKNAPVYMCGGGAAIAGIQTLTAHLLKRCVFPALLPRITGTNVRAPLHSISALAALFAIGEGNNENKLVKNTKTTKTQQDSFSQQSAMDEGLSILKITSDAENETTINPRINPIVNPRVNPRINQRVDEVKTHA